MKQLIDKFQNILKLNDNEIVSAYLKGSKRFKNKVDYWSDTDLLIIHNKDLIDDDIKYLDDYFKPIHGKQLFEYDGGLTYRVVSWKDNILNQYDLQIVTLDFSNKYSNELSSDIDLIYGKDLLSNCNEIKQQKPEIIYDNKHIDDVWFKYYECVKKIARKDNLIGIHLLLDLIREYLVLEMIERDVRLNTNIHRYGNNETIDIEISDLDNMGLIKRLEFIKNLAIKYDKRLSLIFREYNSRLNKFELHIENSKKQEANH